MMSGLRLALVFSLFLSVPVAASIQSVGNTPWPAQTYRSSNLTAPVLNITYAGNTSPGLIFLAPGNSTTQGQHPMIFDDHELVWQGPHGNVSYLVPQTLDAKQVLTYWSGNESQVGWGHGSIHVLNASYHEIYTVTLAGNKTWVSPLLAKFPSYIDKHEIFFTEEGTITVAAVNASQMDLRPFGGPKNGWVQDNLFYEIDIKTNEVLFRWSVLEHLDAVDPSDSAKIIDGTSAATDQSKPWDFAHINAAARYGDQYIVSFKCLDTIYLINKDGSTQWRLNGRTGGDFQLGPGTHFISQHNARIQSQTGNILTISLHNNGVSCNLTKVFPSVGLLLDLNLQTMTVTLNRKLYDSQDPVYSIARGNTQVLPDGHVMVGQGEVSKFEEFDENDNCVMRGWMGNDQLESSYNAFKSNWTGMPQTAPDVFASSSGGMTTLYISWNGATGVEKWEVHSGNEPQSLEYATTVLKNGFETKIEIQGAATFVAVKAIGGPNHGKYSDAVDVLEVGPMTGDKMKQELKR